MTDPPSQTHPASKKRSYQQFMKSQQLVARFKAKSDFVQYFTQSRKEADHPVSPRCSPALPASGYDD